MAIPAIDVSDLVKVYRRRRHPPMRAVDKLSFSVATGSIFGLLGPNGAGKTTTLRVLTTLTRPTGGVARVAGFDVRRNPIAVKRRVGYLPEGAPMWPDMTAEAFLAFVARVRGLGGAEAEQRIATAIRRTQLSDVLRQPIETLSKGFKRRPGLAQALLHDPDVLILDEPTDGLDPNQKHEVRELIRSMAGAKAIVISTHILEEVEAVCSRAIIIANGRIVADETPAGLAARSKRHNGVSLATRAPDKVRKILATLPDVAEVTSEADGRLFVGAKNGASIIAQVSTALREADAEIQQITVEHGRLDEVFREITTRQPAHA